MNLLYQNDVAGRYPQSWYEASVELLPLFDALDADVDCDVCIVGAGFTGLSAALHLAQAGINVVLLDAHRVGWGASGRNGGQLGSGQRLSQTELESRFGFDRALALWQLAEQAKDCVHTLCRRYAIDCDYQPGLIHADHKQEFVKHSRHETEHLARRYGYQDIEFLDKEAVNRLIGSDCYYGGSLDHAGGHLHPLKFALGLAKAAHDSGVRIFENSEIVKTDYSADANKAQRVSAVTKYARVKADYLLYACNGYLGKLAPEVARRVMPINNFIIATEPLSNKVAGNILINNAAVADSRFVVNYFRRSSDQRLLFGGRESYGYRFPADIRSFVREAMLGIYPQLVESKIDYAWGGTLAITRSRLPYLTRLAPNVLSCSGYSGHGVALATLSGRLAAETIQGEGLGFNTMADIPSRPFPGGTVLRSPLLVLAMLWYGLRDRL